MKEINVKIKLLNEKAVLPKYAHEIGDSGMDVYTMEEIIVGAGETVIIPLGFALEMNAGVECQVRNRSGIASKTMLRVSNTPGTVDAIYRGEVGVILTNTSDRDYAQGVVSAIDKDLEINQVYMEEGYGFHKFVEGKSYYKNAHATYVIPAGTRIAQLVFAPVYHANLEVVDELSETVRGDGAYGSSGTQK